MTEDYSSFYNEISKSVPIFAECEVLVVLVLKWNE
jgi:hypothetical protein